MGKKLTNRTDVPHNKISTIQAALKEAQDALKDTQIFISELK